MILICVILLFIRADATDVDISTNATDVIQEQQFVRVSRVSEPKYNMYLLSSNIGISSRLKCSLNCMRGGCASFSYTEVDKRCETYTRPIEEEKGATVNMSTLFFSLVFPFGCPDPLKVKSSGVYRIALSGDISADVFCDIDTAEGPWIVIQRRIDGTVDFNRNWSDYKNGFGDLNGEFWIGNDKLHLLTNTWTTLRVELEAWIGPKGYAEYSAFHVANESEKYKLTIDGFSGDMSNAMSTSSGNLFSTKDRNHDEYMDEDGKRSAELSHCGWWFNHLTPANLNGLMKQENIITSSEVIMEWLHFPDGSEHYPLKTSKMMIK